MHVNSINSSRCNNWAKIIIMRIVVETVVNPSLSFNINVQQFATLPSFFVVQAMVAFESLAQQLGWRKTTASHQL